MKITRGFTIIELLIFIVVTGLLASVGGLALRMVATSIPAGHGSLVALETARQCMEYFSGQNARNGYASITCPSSTVPSYCTVPTGYTLAVNITCTTISGDTNYKTIQVSVGGNGNATLTLLIAA